LINERRLKAGFSLLELVVAIFLIAVVIAAVLLLMAANLNVIDKANSIMLANAVSQYSIEEVKNIEFPPVYSDRQSLFGQPVEDKVPSTFPGGDQPPPDGPNVTPADFSSKYKVERYVIGYKSSGEEIVDWSDIEKAYNEAMQLEILVYVIRKMDNSVVSEKRIFISRNGMY
jgi:type II secretory pathway pseudopilin PulG